MRAMFRVSGFVLFAVVILSACARGPEVIRLDEGRDWAGLKFERLLVVAMTSSEDQQQVLEDGVVEGIRRTSAGASPSYTLFAAHEGISVTDVESAARKIGADGILVARITGIDTSATKAPGREYTKSTCRGGDLVDFFLYDREVLREADSIELAHTITVVTELYSAKTQKRLWMIQSTCFDKQNLGDALQEEAHVIVRQLRRDKLI